MSYKTLSPPRKLQTVAGLTREYDVLPRLTANCLVVPRLLADMHVGRWSGPAAAGAVSSPR